MIRRVNRNPSAVFRTALLLAATAWLAACSGRRHEIQMIDGLAQGTTYTAPVVDRRPSRRRALTRAITHELDRIDALLSNYRADSVLERFNATRSVEAQALPSELITLFELAADIHRRSEGCFDPSVRPLVRLWGFDGDEPHVPAADEIAATLARVGFDKLELVDREHVRKARADLEIDMASIGQGLYRRAHQRGGRRAARATQLSRSRSAASSPDAEHGRTGKSWRVGIENPDKVDAPLRALSLPADRLTAVITSGSYRHYFTESDRVYGHILDPRTGRSVEHDLVSVTVTGATAARTAAWGTALLCLGPAQAFDTADREQIAAIFILKTPAGFEVRQSKAFGDSWGQADGSSLTH